MFQKILIANRGEIAVRIMRTCREMGIKTAAVYSDADRFAAHVLQADEAHPLGGAAPAESYLNMDRLLSIARACGAEAVHPGYGFLAESAAFAERCEAAGLTFIGPPAAVIARLGDKTAARRIMKDAGIPVIPGTLTATEEPEEMCRQAEKIGYPLLVKASAGGGGKGMRVVHDPESMREACVSARSEARKAFGDGSLYLEQRLCPARHVEFQILADHHGHVLHLFERECSIQRRHQKIIEETPAPGLTPPMRQAMGEAAVAAAQAAGYRNAGTVEFLVDASGRFYFLEVNTRLQVEHPITELTTGLDLVRHQVRIAAGEPLELKQEDVRPFGHAIECRIYAEDPEDRFYPSPGRILLLEEPSGPGIRVDSGIHAGFDVPVEYDPILSKVAVHAETREAARQRMLRALERYAVLGVRTTIPFLLDVLRSPAFGEGDTPTDFIDTHFPQWKAPSRGRPLAALVHLATLKDRRAAAAAKAEGLPSPWETLGAWRL